VDGTREIPATPYMLHLPAALPRRIKWVFSSPTSATGCLTEPNTPHTRACKTVGIDGLTLHGLRRSFASLTEWLDVPAGVVAKIQGHKPSATAEKHYKVRPLELLRARELSSPNISTRSVQRSKGAPLSFAPPIGNATLQAHWRRFALQILRRRRLWLAC